MFHHNLQYIRIVLGFMAIQQSQQILLHTLWEDTVVLLVNISQ